MLGATIALTLFNRRFDPSDPKRRRKGLAKGSYTVMSVTTSGKPSSRSKLFGGIGRVWAAVWLVCGTGVLADVTASVTSVMTIIVITGTINSPADLPRRTVAVFSNNTSEKFARMSGLSTRSYPGVEEAILALTTGRVDAIIANALVLKYYAHICTERGPSVVCQILESDKWPCCALFYDGSRCGVMSLDGLEDEAPARFRPFPYGELVQRQRGTDAARLSSDLAGHGDDLVGGAEPACARSFALVARAEDPCRSDPLSSARMAGPHAWRSGSPPVAQGALGHGGRDLGHWGRGSWPSAVKARALSCQICPVRPPGLTDRHHDRRGSL